MNNGFARNAVVFGADSSSLSHSDNCGKNFLILGEGDTFGINGRFGAPEKMFSINFSKANIKSCLTLHYNGDNNYLFVNEIEIHTFKADNKNVSILTQFCLESISNDFGPNNIIEVSLKEHVYDFSVDYNAIDNLKY